MKVVWNGSFFKLWNKHFSHSTRFKILCFHHYADVVCSIARSARRKSVLWQRNTCEHLDLDDFHLDHLVCREHSAIPPWLSTKLKAPIRRWAPWRLHPWDQSTLFQPSPYPRMYSSCSSGVSNSGSTRRDPPKQHRIAASTPCAKPHSYISLIPLLLC